MDARGSLGVPQDFAGMVGLSSGGHIYAANVPQQDSECWPVIFDDAGSSQNADFDYLYFSCLFRFVMK